VADPGFRNAGSKDEALEATRSSDVGAKMEAPRAPRCPLLHAPSTEFFKKDFGSQNGDFRSLCAFWALFFTVQLFGW